MPDRPAESRPEACPVAPERLAKTQREFAAHIRDPGLHPAPSDIENRRMAIYRRLFFNNINSLLAGNFPVLRSLYAEAPWLQLVRDFYAEHRCQTPLFPEVAREFLRYLENRELRSSDPPFLLELAHYEWVELALSLDEREISEIPADAAGDLLSGRPVLSPLAWALSYRYPVHRIKPDFQPAEPPAETTHLLVYRDRHDNVRFMQLNAVTRLLLQQLQDSPGLSGAEHLNQLAQSIGHPNPQGVIDSGAAVLEDLRKRGVLLGVLSAAMDP